MEPWHHDDRATIYNGDCLEVLRALPDASVDAVVTDPPYGLEFMGKDWDAPWKSGTVEWVAEGTDNSHPFRDSSARVRYGRGGEASIGFQLWFTHVALEALRVLKPGGHLLAFGGTRTWHRLACAIEDAGFEVRDSIAWMYGSGFPKSLDVSKAIDKAAGAHRRDVYADTPRNMDNEVYGKGLGVALLQSNPVTDAAREWSGWGTALKPAHEPIVVARKPLVGTVAANVLEHGTGALNIDACRIQHDAKSAAWVEKWSGHEGHPEQPGWGSIGQKFGGSPAGRWPANVVLDEDQAAELDRQSGVLHSQNPATRASKSKRIGATGMGTGASIEYADRGGASRFFYVAKAPARERPKVDGTAHPTVKPLTLMRWLCRLVTPPDGVILEPFAGSGTTVEAALLEGFRVVAIEREADYLPLIQARLDRVAAQEPEDEQLTLDASA
jgi:site-specific DNA-methyltransferase (adenine-specific)